MKTHSWNINEHAVYIVWLKIVANPSWGTLTYIKQQRYPLCVWMWNSGTENSSSRIAIASFPAQCSHSPRSPTGKLIRSPCMHLRILFHYRVIVALKFQKKSYSFPRSAGRTVCPSGTCAVPWGTWPLSSIWNLSGKNGILMEKRSRKFIHKHGFFACSKKNLDFSIT